MKHSKRTIGRYFRACQRGQALVLVSLAIVGLMGMAALVVDVSHVYYAYQELLTATQASALAGASDLATDTASGATTIANNYSAVNGKLNVISNVTNVTMVSGYPKTKCLTSTTGIPACAAFSSGDNAVVVSQTAAVPLTFASILGISSETITTTATAAAKGGYTGPYNIAVVVDTTSSMNTTDSNCGGTRISCSLAAIEAMLQTLAPCPAGLSCGAATAVSAPYGGANVANPVDEVALLVFPGLSASAQVTKDFVCPTSNPTITAYNSSPVYQIISLSSDYRTSDTATTLNSSSDLVIATGGGGCSGVKAPGGEGTFYAGVIDAAQALLVAGARANTKNVMIVLSDGNATATAAQMSNVNTPYSHLQECHQAVTRAQAAATAGTTVYSVAYGSPSTGCTTDTNPAITPCATMQSIASSSQNFFSDYNASGGDTSCTSTSRPVTNLNTIFQQIGGDLTVARLIPNSST
jgi:Flp pilus assembly protein TadG